MRPLRRIRLLGQKIFPTSFLRAIVFIYYSIAAYKKSFSTKGEDIIVNLYFEEAGITHGTYLDIGCYHPVYSSNTHLLHKAGWIGYGVDIDQFKLNAMRAFRGKLITTVLGAISPDGEDGQVVPAYRFDTPWSDIDTLDKASAIATSKKFDIAFEQSEVSLLNINDLFSNLPHINFLDIDIEGLDVSVILALDMERFKPEVIVFEDFFNWGGPQEVQQKLEDYGYQRIFVSGGSIGYAIPLKSRFQKEST
jgi:hypothetical protein